VPAFERSSPNVVDGEPLGQWFVHGSVGVDNLSLVLQ
jgi:hypothetical protein